MLFILILFQGKMKFFDLTPAGRLINRFSSDTYTVDDSLPFILNILLAQTFGLIGELKYIFSNFFFSIYQYNFISI